MGPLQGIRIVELAAIGPVPFAGALFADMGADVVTVDRVGGSADPLRGLLGRGRRRIEVDLKDDRGVELVRRLAGSVDVLLEGMRPGVLERIGLEPDALLAATPGLVIGRTTGWGQEGPYAAQAGHDINYLGVTGGLLAIGDADRPPPPPLNLVADFGGGAMYLVAGVLAALVERQTSGLGQVVDVAMVDGVSSLLSMFHEMRAVGAWGEQRAGNLLDGGAPFYRTYRCADENYVSVGALEPAFYEALLTGLGFALHDVPDRNDRSTWPQLHRLFAERFAQQPRATWLEVFAGTDACVFPVHALAEAAGDPQLHHRGTLVGDGAGVAPGPAPRFVRTPAQRAAASVDHATETASILAALGFGADEVKGLVEAGVVA